MSGLELKTGQLSEDVVLVDVSGSLDSHTHEQLEALLERLFKERCYKIVFKLDRLAYIASAGAGAFIKANDVAQEHGGGICFLSPSKAVRDIFSLLGLDRIFQFASDEDTALDVVN